VAINYATLEIKEAAGIHTITMNRPERRNALNPQMIAELTHALAESAACRCGVVVLTGAGTAFCSGMDLENLKSLSNQRPEDQRADAESTMWMMRRLYELTKPTIAAVNGAAIAGGTGLATLCDFTLAAPQAKFGYTEVKIGFIPAIVSVFLREKKAKTLLLSGRILDAEEALAMGLVTEVVPAGELFSRVHELAALLLKNSPESMSAVKKLLSGFAKERLDRDLTRAMRWNEKIRNSPDFREGLQAFLEKRDPVWPGRKPK
jgi:methylglutaconyl-CoA hydratase